MDPYCIVKYGPFVNQTPVDKNGHKEPFWDIEFILESAPMTSAITFEIYDKDTFGSDDYLG